MAYKYNNELTLEQNISRAKTYRFNQKQVQAKARRIEFNIRYEEVEWNDYCPVFDIKLNWLSEGRPKDNTPSFDRKDPDLGYVTGNVVVMSWRANKLKNNATDEEIKALAEYVEHQYD